MSSCRKILCDFISSASLLFGCVLSAKGAASFEPGATPPGIEIVCKRALKARFRPKIEVVRE
jgi:hypothetical protein